MFVPITIDEFVKTHKANTPSEKNSNIRAVLIETVKAKKDGATCNQCGNPIWAIGSAVVGWNGCFTCISGETDNSEDYEINSVCF